MLDQSQALAAISAPRGMSAADTTAVLDLLMAGTLAPQAAAELLVAWSRRGETAEELAAVVRSLLARAVAVPLAGPVFDLCGTGGSGLERFNVSTTAAFALAAAGVPVAKHGNRGSAKPNGSFDLLDALGVPFQLPADAQARLQRETGVCFLFARAMHPAVAAVAPARKLAAAQVKRTIFNLAGPLANPARPRCQLVGVVDERTAQVVAGALQLLGGERAAVVRGHPGYDEVSLTGATHVWEVAPGHVHHHLVDRLHRHGLRHEDLPGGDASANAATFHRLIDGSESGPLLDLVCLNIAACLDVWEGRPVLADDASVRRARALFSDGAVRDRFHRHRDLARSLAG